MPRGRKTLREESLMADVINLSWRTIFNLLRNENVDQERKDHISLEIVKKSCPKEVKLGAAEGKTIKLYWEIDGNTNEVASESRNRLARPQQV